ncbi:hypothetical protein [Noviherbaspirillum saxi]|uniref:Cell envelope biogenesis protein TolA n=1 Tax=Noviherbaspirillum saxi TaxID=2320863 RepID=A0A3A3GCA4_9BURK|nr:hypothetical protein [Noviherbaspirillum saxi]RJF98519.1 hypothetical protein D3871_08355 [Noviherbaspirillum saxi]
MKIQLTTMAGSLALLFAVSVHAQPAGNPAAQGQASPKDQAEQQHKAAMEKCGNMKDNAKDICKAEADGQKKVAEAQAKVTGRDTPKNRLELDQAKAEAQYKVAKEKCDDQVGDAKKACQTEAKASQDLAIAQAKKQAQTAGSSGAGTAGTSAAGPSPAPAAPSAPAAAPPQMPPTGVAPPAAQPAPPTAAPKQ